MEQTYQNLQKIKKNILVYVTVFSARVSLILWFFTGLRILSIFIELKLNSSNPN